MTLGIQASRLTGTVRLRHARLQLQPRPGGAAAGSARAGPRGAARLARQRHVGDGDEPSRQGVHRDRRSRPRRTCASCSAVPTNYKVLFLQGGATAQFAAVPLNLATPGAVVDYVEHRRLVEEGDRRGEALLHGQRRRGRAATQYTLDSAPSRAGSVSPTRRTCTTRRTRPSAASSSTSCPRSATCRSSPTCPRRSCRGRSTSAAFGVIYAGAQKNIGPAGSRS